MSRRRLFTLLLGASLLAPIAALAQDHDHHTWSDSEDPHWREYLKEHHKKYHDWSKAKKREQEDYWKWRDAHPDVH